MSHLCATAGSNTCHALRVCISAFMVVSTKLLASSMKRAHALFVFVIARLCAPKSESLFLMSLLFNSGLACLIHVSSVLTSKRRDHFNSEHLKSVHSKKKAVASVHDLMDDAARVRSLEYAAALTCSLARGMLT
jgi:hypothetical protein